MEYGLDIRLATACRIERFDCSFHKGEKGTVIFQGGAKTIDVLFAYAPTGAQWCGVSKNTFQLADKLAVGPLRIGSTPWNLFQDTSYSR